MCMLCWIKHGVVVLIKTVCRLSYLLFAPWNSITLQWELGKGSRREVVICFNYLKDDSQPVLRSLSIPMLHYKSHSMECEWTYSLQATYLIFEAFQIVFPTALLIFSVVSASDIYENERSIKLRLLRIHNYGSCFETLNLLYVSSCKMFTFCVVLHETKQKT